MSVSNSHFACSGCGARPPDTGMPPFRCPRASEGDDIDHVLVRHLDTSLVSFPKNDEKNPFLAFRTLFASQHRAPSDSVWVERMTRLDRKIAEIDGHGFIRTPFGEERALATGAGWSGRLFVKDETTNVSGSHKARHLMGLIAYLETLSDAPDRTRPLAISSCGNAALAAAVVARAASRRLLVFVPTWANPTVLARLSELGAELRVCERGSTASGDPCTLAFRKAVADGAIPFSCQGSDNGLVVEGGMTLGYEILSATSRPPDRVFVQVGGGALASACIAAFEEAAAWRITPQLPAFHAIQTDAVAPLSRAWTRLMRKLLPELGFAGELPAPDDRPAPLAQSHACASFVRAHPNVAAVESAIRYAATHRSEFMWPWEQPPSGLASGILDDETYDFLAILRGMLRSGGFPIVVSNDLIAEANRLARAHTQIQVDHTGSSGLAGLLAFARAGIATEAEDAIVLFTGRIRNAS